MKQMVDRLVEVARTHQKLSPHQDDVMILMGGDFSHSNAFTWFRHLDKLVHYANLVGTALSGPCAQQVSVVAVT